MAPGDCQLASVNFPLSSTSVENPLQIGPFLQNKANLLMQKINATFFSTKDYENEIIFMLQKNKPKQSLS